VQERLDANPKGVCVRRETVEHRFGTKPLMAAIIA
jgi:hypothetical protein